MEQRNGVSSGGRVAVVTCETHGGGFAALAATLDTLRDEDVRAVVLDTAGMRDAAWDAREAATIGEAVLPLVAAWMGAPGIAALAAGLFADIRVGDASLVIDTRGTGEIGGAVARRLALLLENATPPRERLSAEAAMELGLVSANAAQGQALAAALRIAEAIAERGPIATRLAKEAAWRGLAMPIEQGLRLETDLTLLLQATKDRDEGVRAFLEKRTPEFEGV